MRFAAISARVIRLGLLFCFWPSIDSRSLELRLRLRLVHFQFFR